MSDRSTKLSKLQTSKESRAAYIKAKLNVLVPSQIRALRLKLIGTQKELAAAAEMKQPRISAMERPGAVQFNVDTLVRLAAAFKVGLLVKFVSFSEMLRWENEFSQDDFAVARIDEDTSFLAPVATRAALATRVEFEDATGQPSQSDETTRSLTAKRCASPAMKTPARTGNQGPPQGGGNLREILRPET
jgi:transcriptional regulator with XRE-family HTH domain